MPSLQMYSAPQHAPGYLSHNRRLEVINNLESMAAARDEDEIALELDRATGVGLTLLVLLYHGGDEQKFGAKQQVPREGKC